MQRPCTQRRTPWPGGMTEERCVCTHARDSGGVITQHDAVAMRIIKSCALASASAQQRQGPSRVAVVVVARVVLCQWCSCVIVQLSPPPHRALRLVPCDGAVDASTLVLYWYVQGPRGIFEGMGMGHRGPQTVHRARGSSIFPSSVISCAAHHARIAHFAPMMCARSLALLAAVAFIGALKGLVCSALTNAILSVPACDQP